MRTADLHLQRSTETLLGYLQGITCDDHLNDLEIAKLQGWLETHHALRQHYPFDELGAQKWARRARLPGNIPAADRC